MLKEILSVFFMSVENAKKKDPPLQRKEMNGTDDLIYVEIHNAKRILWRLNEMESLVKILDVSYQMQNTLLEYISEIKESIKEAKLKEEAYG
jgi:hypothetical protein